MNELTKSEGSAVVQNTAGLKEIKLCPDGKYRWVYEMNMLKNPTLLLTLYKFFGIVVLILMVILLLIGLFSDDFLDALIIAGKISLFMAGFFAVLMPVGYLLVAAIYKGKYIVVFEMDEHGIEHRQLEAQVKRIQAMEWLTALAGLARGSLSTMGAGILGATKTASYSSFESVFTVKPHRWRHMIEVNQPTSFNEVYVDEDFDFVLDYIRKHCPKVK
jgi:hypothetical protein